MLSFAIFAIVLLLVCFFALRYMSNVYNRELYEKSVMELEYYIKQTENKLQSIEELSERVALDSEIQSTLSSMDDVEYLSSDYMVLTDELRRLILYNVGTSDYIKAVKYTDGNALDMTVINRVTSPPKETKEKLMEEFGEKQGGYAYYSPTENYPYLVSGRYVRELKGMTLKNLGAVIFISDIKSIINENRDGLSAESSRLYICGENGEIYRDEGFDDILLTSMGEGEDYHIIRADNEKYFVCRRVSDKTGWIFINSFPYTEIYGQIILVRNVLAGLFFLYTIIGIAVGRRIVRNLLNPLNELNRSVKIVESGDFKAAEEMLKDNYGRDEIGELASEFKYMLGQIDNLINENYKKQLLLKDTSYKMLRSQINSHFIYNTLNTIAWMVRLEKNSEAAAMLVDFGDILRASLAKEPYTTVSEEVDIAEKYMYIQSFRYEDKLDFQMDTSGSLDKYMIPRLVLQPLLENAINYGVEEKAGLCRVSCTINEKENGIYIEIRDSGRGMSADELKAVREGTVKPKGHGIGIQNIRERFALIYSDFDFDIESEKNEGTAVKMRIPKIRREDFDV